MTTEIKRKEIPEQTAQHVYNPVPARRSAAATEEPPASRQRMNGSRQPPPPHSQPRTNAPQEEEYDDDHVYPQRSPSSARRYKQPEPPVDTRTVRTRRSHTRGFYTLIVICSIFVGIVIATFVPPLWQRGVNQVVYSYPRISQADANVGHGTAKYPDDHFIAINNHGYVEVLEIPEGVPDKDHPPQIYLVARPDGADADQAPATLTFEDVNGDGKVDIIVHCNGNESILYNDGHTFKPTP